MPSVTCYFYVCALDIQWPSPWTLSVEIRACKYAVGPALGLCPGVVFSLSYCFDLLC